jgi:6-phosphogluconolactonase
VVSVHRIDPDTGALKLQGSYLVGKNPSWVEIVDVN